MKKISQKKLQETKQALENLEKKEYTKNTGIFSLVMIILVMIFVLVFTIYSDNTITGRVVDETITYKNIDMQIQELETIYDLITYNEGFYEIRNGYVYYIEGFDEIIPLNLKIKKPSQMTEIVSIDSDGSIEFVKNEDQ